ncbi:hypothetical protein B0H12DRAFT_1238220 [Mycena haematopus]|nr:hypothetical protein B0H12DRAFT_1238220 [Mycena haematopus]
MPPRVVALTVESHRQRPHSSSRSDLAANTLLNPADHTANSPTDWRSNRTANMLTSIGGGIAPPTLTLRRAITPPARYWTGSEISLRTPASLLDLSPAPGFLSRLDSPRPQLCHTWRLDFLPAPILPPQLDSSAHGRIFLTARFTRRH